MTIDELINVIDDNLQSLNSDDAKRIEAIEHLLDFLQYNLRLTKLTEREKLDFVYCMEGYPLTEKQRKILEKEPKLSNTYIERLARSTYFRRCDWLQFLHGEIQEKPIPLEGYDKQKFDSK